MIFGSGRSIRVQLEWQLPGGAVDLHFRPGTTAMMISFAAARRECQLIGTQVDEAFDSGHPLLSAKVF